MSALVLNPELKLACAYFPNLCSLALWAIATCEKAALSRAVNHICNLADVA
jgi:hypothetical protein